MSMYGRPQAGSPLRMEGFSIPGVSSHLDSHSQTASAPLSISPHMLHSPFSSVGGPGHSIGPGGGGGGSGIFTDELLESLTGGQSTDSFLGGHYQPSSSLGSGDMSNSTLSHHHHSNSVGNNNTNNTYGQPLRSLPRHLDPTGSYGGNPSSPGDVYSPGSGSTSAGLSGTDFFPDHTEYGSFSPATGDEMSSGHSKDGSGGAGAGATVNDRMGSRNVTASSGKAPSSRSRSIVRRSSGSYSRHTAQQGSINIPQTPAQYAAPSIGYSSLGRPQAASVPTYLQTHHGSPETTGWSSPTTNPFSGSFSQSGYYANIPAVDPIGMGPTAALKAANRNSALAPSSAPVGMGISPKDHDRNDPASPIISDKQAAVLSEKRRRRRESHNAVEQRRRNVINDRIAELATLLPEVLLDNSMRNASVLSPAPEEGGEDSSGEGTAPVTSSQAAAAAAKPNKGVILSKSVEYIGHLGSMVEVQASQIEFYTRRTRELEDMIRELGGHLDLSASTMTITDSREGLIQSDAVPRAKRESSTPSNPFDRMEE